MGLRRVMGGTLLFVALLAMPAAAVRADALDDALAQADKRLAGRLRSLAQWAAGKRISGFRHRVFRIVLKVAPDDSKARGALKYKRKRRDGPWVQAPDYREPPDWAKGLLPKARQRVQEALVRYRTDVLEALDAAGDVEPARQDARIAALLDLLPQDAVVHERLGDVQHEGRWMLPESVEARTRRAWLRAFVATETARVGKEIVKFETARTKGWGMAWSTERRRVYGEVPAAAGRSALRAMEVADALCTELFGPAQSVRGPEDAIFLTTREQARDIVGRNPEWKSTLADVERVRGLYLPTGEYMSYRASSDMSRRGAVRQVIDSGIKRRFRGSQRGWMTEGLGQRITWYIEGEHGPAFVSLERTERHTTAESGDELPKDPNAWNRAAANALARDGPARLAGVLTRRINAMQAADVLVAYGLAAYLLETRPQEFLSFAEATVKRHDVDALVRDTLGADDVAMLAGRLQRWLREN